LAEQTEAILKSNSLTVVLPVNQESINLSRTYESIAKALKIADISDYEIIIISQATPEGQNNNAILETINGLLNLDLHIAHIQNRCFVGLGTQYRQGISRASKDYVVIIPPYRLVEDVSLAGLLLYLDQTDAVFTYPGNTEIQPSEVRYVSKGYSVLCNVLFALNLKSYSGISIVKRNLLVKVPAQLNDQTCLAEMIIYLAKSGINYLELPYVIRSNGDIKRYGNISNAIQMFGSLLSLFWRINVKDERLTLTPETMAKSNFVLPTSGGSPDLNAMYQFASGNAIQVLHQMIIYLGKSADKYFTPQTSNSGQLSQWSPGVQDTFNAIKIVKVLNSITTKVLAMISAVDNISDKITRKKRKGRRKKNKISLTVIMPAYNEAEKIFSAYQQANRALHKAGIKDYEILIVTNLAPDGSHDGTPDIVANIAKTDSHVRHIHHENYVGLGFKYRQGINEAKKYYAMMIPGDGEFDEDSTANVISNIGKAEIIIPYISNQEIRPPERQTTSRAFSVLCNKLFGLDLRYYNGLCIIPVDYLKAVPMDCDNFAYMAQILIYLLRSGVDYLEVPWKIKRVEVEGSKSFRPESVNEVLETISTLFWKINIEGKRVELPTVGRS